VKLLGDLHSKKYKLGSVKGRVIGGLALRGAYVDEYVKITRRQHQIMAELIN
jgi:hypothetical protein